MTKEEIDAVLGRLEEEMPGGVGLLKEFLLAREPGLGYTFTPENEEAAGLFAHLLEEATRG